MLALALGLVLEERAGTRADDAAEDGARDRADRPSHGAEDRARDRSGRGDDLFRTMIPAQLVLLAAHDLCDASPRPGKACDAARLVHRPSVREWLAEAPFSLALSAGFFGFFAHAGFVSALEELGLRPRLVTGASAGALVGGLWASGTPAARIEAELRPLRRAHFWDPAYGFRRVPPSADPPTGFGLLRGELFRARVAAMLGASDLERAPIRAALSAFDVRRRKTVVLDRGDLARAICASCAFPALLQPVNVDGRPMLDGGIADRPGHAGLDAHPRVLFHHLASRSPWRARQPAIPSRDGMTTIMLRGLPRLGPFRLERGAEAFDRARAATLTALQAPLDSVIVRDA